MIPDSETRIRLPLAEASGSSKVRSGIRSDAARNRDTLLCVARRMVEEFGVGAVTMDQLAAAAGVGKGTVFRRFGSRAGVMAALLDESERTFQDAVISGEPPLGPGAEPLSRLLAFGEARLRANLAHGELIAAAGGGWSAAVHAFDVLHVRHLLAELGVEGDLPLLASGLMAPLEVALLQAQIGPVDGTGIAPDRLIAAWQDLARRVVGHR